jgi:hypothetical protein
MADPLIAHLKKRGAGHIIILRGVLGDDGFEFGFESGDV